MWLVAFLAGPVQGDDFIWSRTGDNGNWSSTANWSGPGGRFPDDPDEQAIFNSPAGMGMPIQNASMTNGLGQLTFNYTGWTVYVDPDPLRFNSITNYGYNAINSYATGGAGLNIIYPGIEFLGDSQIIHTGSGSTLVIAYGGFIGSYGPTISSVNPTSSDTGAVRLDVASSVSGPFYLRQGTLLVRNSSALGTSTATVNIGGDQYVTDGGNARLLTDAANVTVPKNLRVRSYTGRNVNATIGGNQTSGNSIFSGTITLDLNATLTSANTDGNAVSFTNTISGVGGITKAGPGRVVLSAANSYQGATAISTGMLSMGAAGVLPSTTAVTLANAAGTSLSLNGFNQTIGSLSGGGGLGGGVALGSAQLTVGSGNYAGSISGAGGSLRKTGAGTLALSGSNSYTGDTWVTAGMLLVNGTHANGGGYTVASNATLGGTGTIGANINVQGGGILAPGISIGALTVNGAVGLGGTLKVEVVDLGGIGAGGADLLSVSDNLDITKATVDFDVFGIPQEKAYVFADYSSLTGRQFAKVVDLPAGYYIDYNYLNENKIALVIPEPCTLGLLILGGLGLRRRRW
ncbi:MAG TPA: autotransporter-associated beta strand repeat-containing protein [Phycisphaerae bacterium]|nr:autotransporter-associated beta strand repeat-containing protein [Phycisphaerae bacterium]